MDLFSPSKKILDAICEEENPLKGYEIHIFGSIQDMYMQQLLYLSSLYERLKEFYVKDLNEDKNRLDMHGIAYVGGELFKNWADHTQENHNLMTGWFFGSKGVCYGFYDGGDFFKDDKIKLQIESKRKFRSFDSSSRGETCQIGFNMGIYHYSDLLEVDSEKGIIYAVQLKENIIAPEGQSGSGYCFQRRKMLIRRLI